VEIKFYIGNYKDNVLCDVVPMEACHVLLGRPWQFDKKTLHNDLTNEISFIHKHKKFVLSPLPHSQVVKDQIQMKNKRDEEKIEKEKTFGKQKAWEKSVPSHKVIQQVKHIENTLANMLLVEQPSLTYCKGTLASMSTKEESLNEACKDKDYLSNVLRYPQKNVKLAISTYQISYEVVPRTTCHVLLRQPLQSVQIFINNGCTNETLFAHERKSLQEG